jgi:hypothetical protein
MAQRAGMRRAVQIIVVAVTLVVVGMSVLDHKYVQAYGTPVGQLVLSFVMLMFAGGFFWLRRLSRGQDARAFPDTDAVRQMLLEYVLLGAAIGLGVYVLIRALVPSRRSATVTVAQIDALRELGPYSVDHAGGKTSVKETVGRRTADFYARQGWQLRSLRADLAILDRSWESFLTTKVGLAAYGFVLVPVVYGILWVAGAHLNFLIPLWLTLLFAAGFFILPDLEVRQKARERREDFRRVVSAYLDLVAMNLAGGRGLPRR